eukprot:12228329-Ditylum_brightwellii.AAC.1
MVLAVATSKQNTYVDDSKEDGVGNRVESCDKNLTHLTKAVDYCSRARRESVEGGDKHLTHLIQAVACNLKARCEQSTCVDNSKEDSVENSVDSGDTHLIHLTQAVDCHLKTRSKQNTCVDDGKEDGIVKSEDSGDKHLTHLTQVDVYFSGGEKSKTNMLMIVKKMVL